MDKPRADSDFENDAGWRKPLASLDEHTVSPSSHDSFVMQAAGETAKAIGARSRRGSRWQMPMALAASFIVGVGAALLYTADRSDQTSALSGLVLPVTPEIRGAPQGTTIPVEQAPPDVWYRYIQELVYSGDAELASRHLQRFVELHPDFVKEP